MTRIQNAQELISHGNIAGRQAMVEILEAGLQASNPYHNIFKLVRYEDDTLTIGGVDFEPPGDPQAGDDVINLNEVGRIFVFGAGKGIQHTAKALEDILGDRLTGGHVIAKHGDELILEKIGVTFGAHPVPDEGCVEGCQRILEMTTDLREDDLVFTVIGNGVSALLTLPVDGVSLEDVRRTTHLFQIERGGKTIDLTPIRNRLDQLKGGRLSRHLQPARAIHIISFVRRSYHDLMFDDLNRWLHILPDYQTYETAIANLKKLDAWNAVPTSVREHLLRADPAQETLRMEEYLKMRTRIFCSMPEHIGVLPTVAQKATELGFTPHVLYNNYTMQSEASHTGKLVANLARHSELDNEPFEPPCALISRGEMVVTVGDGGGMGGRNQEYALTASLELEGTHHIVMGSVDTDGTDGPGHQFVTGLDEVPVMAGAIVDSYTPAHARQLDLDLFAELKRHNTSPALHKLGDGLTVSPNIAMGDLSVTLIMNHCGD